LYNLASHVKRASHPADPRQGPGRRLSLFRNARRASHGTQRLDHEPARRHGRSGGRRREKIDRRMDRRTERRSALRRGDADRSGDERIHRTPRRLRREVLMDLKTYIRDVPDFPKPGILFKDITPLLRAPEALDESMQQLAA